MSEAVMVVIPITEILVIRLITFFFRLAERYLRAMYKETLMAYFFKSRSISLAYSMESSR